MHLSIDSSLKQWLQYIEAIHPVEIELGLSRLQTVAANLFEQPRSIVFSVAGTNGKGTTTAALNSLAIAAGKSVGWYSSPHLLRFNERIKLNGEPVSDDMLVNAFAAVEQARGDVSLSYFEYTTLAAFYCFSQENLDVWVLEIGLGGKLDAVNIIDPDVSIVTNIGLDHQGYLGDSLDSIGFEKAGISRLNKPVVLGSADLPKSVLDTISNIGGEAHIFGEQHGVSDDKLYWQGGSMGFAKILIPFANAATAVQAFVLSEISITLPQIENALKVTRMPGRLQEVYFSDQLAVLDVGHNPHAARYIANKLSGQEFHLVIGMLGDKDPLNFIKELEPITKTLTVVTLDVPRGLTASELKNKIGKNDVLEEPSVSYAISSIKNKYPGEALFVGGSFYTVCDALALLENSVGT